MVLEGVPRLVSWHEPAGRHRRMERAGHEWECRKNRAMNFVLRILALAVVVGLIGLLTYQNYWRSRQLAVRAKQLELEALQARIRPHFLFNTLNTGAALVHAQPDAAERVLLDLADLFRSALRGPQLIPLAEELALAHRYLEIEQLLLRRSSALELASAS